jgi:transcriptional regulator of acetoin/glycerol metabolism
VLFCRGSIIETADLPSPLQSQTPDPRQALFQDLPSLDELERRYLLHVIEAVGRNRSRAAAVMGIDRRTLYRMAERFGIDLSEPTDDS